MGPILDRFFGGSTEGVAAKRSPDESWMLGYASAFLVALCTACALSPVTIQGWHVVVALHAACLPTARWVEEWVRMGSRKRMRLIGAGLVVQLLCAVIMGMGHPMYTRQFPKDPPGALSPILPGLAAKH